MFQSGVVLLFDPVPETCYFISLDESSDIDGMRTKILDHGGDEMAHAIAKCRGKR